MIVLVPAARIGGDVKESIVPPVRSRMPTTAGPWQVSGRFDGSGGDVEPGPITGPGDVDGVGTWLQRFDERVAGILAPSAGPKALRQLSLGGRQILPSSPSPMLLRSTPPGVRANQPFILTATDDGPERVPGASVGDGAFELNDVTIPVSGFDSLEEVLDRIDRSGAGVSARFDPLVGEIVLRSAARGAGARIALGRDTSRFLAEFGLEQATPQPGLDAGYDGPLGRLGGLGAVVAGMVVVNGIAVVIDPDVDPLPAALDRLTLATDAVAVFDATSRRVVLAVSLPPGALEIDDATGLFDSLGFAPGVYTSVGGRPETSPTLVIRSWAGAGDRVLRREPEPGDHYLLAATRSFGDGGRAGRRVLGRGAITDRIASTPGRRSVERLGTAEEEIAIRRQFLG